MTSQFSATMLSSTHDAIIMYFDPSRITKTVAGQKPNSSSGWAEAKFQQSAHKGLLPVTRGWASAIQAGQNLPHLVDVQA
eukprot:3550136-Rhodomonas_salina.1